VRSLFGYTFGPQKNLDLEAMEELKEQHAKMTNMQNAMASGDLKSGYVSFCASHRYSGVISFHDTDVYRR